MWACKSVIAHDCVSVVSLQDKSVAFKIFELGMKRYGEHEEYMLAYIDFMGHINGECRHGNAGMKQS